MTGCGGDCSALIIRKIMEVAHESAKDFFLVPKLCLGTPFIKAKLSLAIIFVPKCNLGTS
jgi:hypothetical protein